MPRYLLKQRQGWYAVLEIPKALRPYFGKARFKETLGTDSIRVAQIKVLPIVAEWKSWIEAARKGDKTLEAQVQLWRQKRQNLKNAKVPEHEIEEAFFNIALDSDDPEKGIELLNVSSGRWIRLSSHVDEYMASLGDLNTPKTKDMKRSDIMRFVRQFDYAHEVTKKKVINWVEGVLIAKDRLSAPTCSRIVSSVRGYWDFLERHKALAIATPFVGVVPNRKKAQRQSGKKIAKRSHFTPDEFQKLLANCAHDTPLANLIWLGAYTGCRIEELCSLKLRNVTNDRFIIEDAKTSAGWREVPIHGHIQRLVADLKKTTSDDYLLGGLSFNKYGDRSNAIGKRFGRLRNKAGFGPELVFHSFRKGVATQLETAGVAENITARLLGHEFHTMSYGVYSGGVSFEVLEKAASNINWTSQPQTAAC